MNVITQLILEKEIKVSKTLEDTLKQIPVDLAKRLLDFLASDKIKDDANIEEIDYDEDDPTKLIIKFKDKTGNIKKRPSKIGKLLSYIGANEKINPKGYELESLISYLKNSDSTNVKVLEGDDIKTAYDCRTNNLNSCMTGNSEWLDIYSDNPEKVKLAVLYDNNDALLARALLWKMENGRMYLDRIYSTDSESDAILKSYGKKINAEMYDSKPSSYVQLESGDYEYYPHADTFKYYNTDTGIIDAKGVYKYDRELNQTDGTADGQNNGVYSERYGINIDIEDAIYDQVNNDYIFLNDAVTLEDGRETHKDNAALCDIGSYKGKYILKDLSVKDYKGKTLHNNDANVIGAGPNEDKNVLDEESILDVNNEWIEFENAALLMKGDGKGEYLHKENAVKDWGGYYIDEDEALTIGGNSRYTFQYAVVDELTEDYKDEYILSKNAVEKVDGNGKTVMVDYYEIINDIDSEFYNSDEPKPEGIIDYHNSPLFSKKGYKEKMEMAIDAVKKLTNSKKSKEVSNPNEYNKYNYKVLYENTHSLRYMITQDSEDDKYGIIKKLEYDKPPIFKKSTRNRYGENDDFLDEFIEAYKEYTNYPDNQYRDKIIKHSFESMEKINDIEKDIDKLGSYVTRDELMNVFIKYNNDFGKTIDISQGGTAWNNGVLVIQPKNPYIKS